MKNVVKKDDSAAKNEPLGGTVALSLGAGFGRGFAPEASRTGEKARVFTGLSSGSGGVPWGTHARARGNAFCVLRTVRRAAEGEPPRLEGGGSRYIEKHLFCLLPR